jgi:hypothetical protein
MKCIKNISVVRKRQLTRLISIIQYNLILLISFCFFIQNPEHGLRISAQRGLPCIFQALARKTSTIGLGACNDHSNLTLMHYAV